MASLLAAGPAAETTRHVATGDIGYGFGPYAYAHNAQPPPPPRPKGPQKLSRARPPPTTAVSDGVFSPPPGPPPGGGAQLRRGNTWRMPSTNAVPATVLADTKGEGRASTEETAVERDPEWDAIPDDVMTVFSGRGWVNALTLVTIVVAILVLFAGYPIITRFVNPPPDLSRFDARIAHTPSRSLTPTPTSTTSTDDSTPTTPTDDGTTGDDSTIDDGTGTTPDDGTGTTPDDGTGTTPDDGTGTDDGTVDDGTGFLIKRLVFV